MARGGAISGEASAPLPVYPTEQWTCECGDRIYISLTPTALSRRDIGYKHVRCGGAYRPEPGREAAE